MDRKIIQQFGTEILCYRLRTARQKKRMQYKDFDKQLIQLDKEHSELWYRRNRLGYEPLIPPVQKGWKRCFVLREEVARSQHAALYEGILKKINTWNWSHRRNFLVKRRNWGRKFYVVKPQKLQELYSWEFQKLGFTEMERRLFHTVEDFNAGRFWATKYVFSEPWRFTLQVRPNIIDKVRIRDPELDSRIRQFENYFERNDLEGRRNKLVRGKGYKRRRAEMGEKYDERSPLKNKPLRRILDKLEEEYNYPSKGKTWYIAIAGASKRSTVQV